jgi:CAAX protease family protein
MTVPEAPPPLPPTAVRLPPDSASVGRLWLEVLAVLAFAWLPDVFNAVASLCWPELSVPRSSAYAHLALVMRSIQVSAPVLYIIWRSGDPWSYFGLMRPAWAVDPLLGLGIFLIGAFIDEVNSGVSPGPRDPTAQAASGVPAVYLLYLVASCANGFAEELVMRGYLLPRLRRLCGSAVAGVALTSVLFAAYHVHQGPSGALSILLLGLVYGTAFCLAGRLWPVAVAHALVNFLAMARVG